MDMRPRLLTLLPMFGVAVLFASPAAAGQHMRLNGIMGVSGDAASATCAVADDARHDKWVDLISVGSALDHSAADGRAGRVLVKVRGSKASGVVKAWMACGGKLRLTLRVGKRVYLLSGVTIRETVSSPARRDRANTITTYQISFTKVVARAAMPAIPTKEFHQ